MTAVRAFCIRMRCNLSAVSSCKSYLTGPGHRSGNDSVLFRYCPHLKIAPLAIELKGFRSRAHEGLSCPSFIHFQATDAVRLSTSWCLSQPLLFSRSLRIIWEKFSPRDYPWYFREPARHPVPRLLICQSFTMSPGQTQVWHCRRSVKQDWTCFFFLIKLLKGPLLWKLASAQPLTLLECSKKADHLQSFEITISNENDCRCKKTAFLMGENDMIIPWLFAWEHFLSPKWKRWRGKCGCVPHQSHVVLFSKMGRFVWMTNTTVDKNKHILNVYIICSVNRWPSSVALTEISNVSKNSTQPRLVHLRHFLLCLVLVVNRSFLRKF